MPWENTIYSSKKFTMKKVLTQKAASCFYKFSLLLFTAAMLPAFQLQAQPTLTFSQVYSGYDVVTAIRNAKDGTNRLFIVEKSGKIKIRNADGSAGKTFLDLTADITPFAGEEQGLLSLAFHPQYKTNRAFFVLYTDLTGKITVARFFRTISNADSADPASKAVLISQPKPGGLSGHNGGDLNFGTDKYLYISLGDGGGVGDPFNVAQDGSTILGKMLRLDVMKNNRPYYKIPPDNPYINDPNVLDEIYALGLRNPWHWSFDRQTGDMWLPDVGELKREEINFRTPAQAAAGNNYGWRCYEGNIAYNTTGCAAQSSYVSPIYEYRHIDATGGYAVIGGYVYRGNILNSLKGYYVCADYVIPAAWLIKPDGIGGWTVTRQATGVPTGITTFGEAENGELYVATYDGNVYTVGATAAAPFTNSAASQNASDAITNSDTKSFVYPSLVDAGYIKLVLNESFRSVQIIDMNGQKVFQQSLQGGKGVITITLPRLAAGMYNVQLAGDKTLQQKIYITH